MLFENLDPSARDNIITDYIEMTRMALSQVFGKSEHEAANMVGELISRFDYAPKREMNLLLNTDPVALACDLSGTDWEKVDMEKLKIFNSAREARLVADRQVD